MSVFAGQKEADWKEFYGDVEEELPAKMPKPRGKPVNIYSFVDANHAGNVATRRSHRYNYLRSECADYMVQQASKHGGHLEVN